MALGLAAVAALSAVSRAQPAERADPALARCVGCHSIAPDDDTPAGPTLHGIARRAIAGRPGFDYSPAMRRFGREHGRWSPALLDRFLAAPETVVRGTEMSFEGIADPAERAAAVAALTKQ